jgi:mannose-6-phosphate isomerase-like protein (cupin superfamily)/2'-5' RNA ligase
VENRIKNQKSKIIHLRDCDEFIAGDGSVLRELLHPDKTNIAIRYSLAHAVVKPGARTKPHRLKTAEVYYIIEGQGRMHIDAEVSEVSENCAVYIPPRSTQSIENTGATGLVFLCLVDPAWRREDEEIVEGNLSRWAVDVVLLPDEAMTNRAIEIYRQLITSGRPEIVLGKKDYLPHVSLAMGCIDEANVKAIQERLEDLARKTTVRQLEAVGVISPINSRGETVSVLEVERTEELQALHEWVLEEMTPFFHYEVTEAMIYGDVVTETTLDWIRTYPEKAGYEHFSPHLTVGYGQVPPGLSFPIPFTVTRLALCHLGDHCTCRRILAAVELRT